MRRFPPVPAAAVFALTLAMTGCGDDSSTDTADPSSTGVTADPSDDATTTSFVSQLFSTDFETVCAGATQSRATPYEATEPGPHKLILLQGPKGKMYESTVDVPEDWQVTWTEKGDALTAIELVACSELVPGDVVKQCDGYEDSDGTELDTKVDLRNATYEVTLREAATGDEVASTTIDAVADDCPMVISSDDTQSFADDNLAIVEFLRPYVQGA